MMEGKFKYIYGPVYSWRLGMSLGIDPLSDGPKICNMDCVYCQLGRSALLTNERRVYVPTETILEEIRALPPMDLDYLTFSGRGEPTLAGNLGDMIRGLRALRRERIAVITNALLINRPEVQEDLGLCDFVLAKLDACDQVSLEAVDKPVAGVTFEEIVGGIKTFRQGFKGKLALQLMFIAENRECAPGMARVARDIGADEVEINTPLRPSGAAPLSERDLDEIKTHFGGLPVKTVFETQRREVTPLDERETVKRHGNYKKTAWSGADHPEPDRSF